MAVKRKKDDVSAEADMTPMIDMTFQLIAFFMVLINFAEDNQDQRIRLPSSELARPPEGPSESPVTLQVTKEGIVLLSGDEVPISSIGPALVREVQMLNRSGKSPKQAHVIIRADGQLPAGKVQELIKMCQDKRFENFTLRAQTKSD